MGADMSEASRFTVGEWTVAPTRCLLEHAGRSVKVKPRTMQLLTYLVSRAGQVVSVDELVASVWQGRVVSDGAIYHTINQLRQALGDDKGDVRFIQTLPKQGYRLVAPVALPPDTDSPPSRTVAYVTPRTVGIVALGLVVVVIGSLGLGSSVEERAAISPNSIAVLPFSNGGSGEEDTVFTNGIHNETLTQLGKISALTVRGRPSVLEYRDSPKSVREIGRELNVATVLLGQVQRAGDMVRVNVQLVEAENNRSIWTDSYSRALTAENIFAIQREIATAIADQLNAALTPAEVARLNEVHTKNSQAWLHYQSGIDYADRDGLRALELAEEQFEAAVREDPEYALAWAGLSLLHSQRYTLGHDPSAAQLERVLEAAKVAEGLAPGLPEVHLALAQYYAGAEDRERALEEFEIASRGMPNNADLYRARYLRYRRMGRWDEAIVLAEKARDLGGRRDACGAGWIHLDLRNYELADDCFDAILRISPDDPAVNAAKAELSLWRDGDATATRMAAASSSVLDVSYRMRMGWIAALYDHDWALALEYARNMEELYEGDRRYIPKDSYLGVTHQLAGQQELAEPYFEKSRAHLERILIDNREDARLHVSMGEVLVGLDQIDEAVRYAQNALELLSREMDAIAGPRIQRDVIVRVFAPAGAVDAVIEELDDYLAHPGIWSLAGFLPDPRFDLIRDDPDIQAFVERRRSQ